MQTATPLYWGEPLGFAVGFTPVLPEGLGLDAETPIPLLSDDGCDPAQAACFHSGDDLIVRAATEPPTPVEHPEYGELWQAPDALLFRTQAQLDAWAAEMA